MDEASSKLPSQKLPVLSAHTNEGPHGILSQTHGIDSKSASTKENAADKRNSIEVNHKIVGTSDGRCECSIEKPHNKGVLDWVI